MRLAPLRLCLAPLRLHLAPLRLHLAPLRLRLAPLRLRLVVCNDESLSRIDSLNINVALFSYTRAFGDGPRSFEPWSSGVDDT
ncbi:hypothetical protein TNCV_3833461 [Trichonephila clavipes]|nr:hypothetical protein TNCV_3833461 [Trichonephila clavipes]